MYRYVERSKGDCKMKKYGSLLMAAIVALPLCAWRGDDDVKWQNVERASEKNISSRY